MPIVDLFVYVYSKKLTAVKIAFLVVLFILAVWALWTEAGYDAPLPPESAQ